MKRKIKMLIPILMAICIAVCLCACSKAPSFELKGEKTFTCKQGTNNISDKSSVRLNFDDMTFKFSESLLSNVLNVGSFEIVKNEVILKREGEKDGVIVFEFDGDAIVFNAEKSAPTMILADRARLVMLETPTDELTKTEIMTK
ncbi:MAG: hypothetical protein NC110_03945 [Ruminococcus sp.]|nr:hypothetical protein [Ruminococcus sp.]